METSSSNVDLETKIAFLERTLDTLNEVILDQGRSIETLERKLARLESRMESGDTGADDVVDPLEERPPHY